MSWLNLNQSLNSLKGQITNFASEVLSEGIPEETEEKSVPIDAKVEDLEEKCRQQELEIQELKVLADKWQKHSQRNGIKDDALNWYWDDEQGRSTDEPKYPNKRTDLMQREEIERLKEENKNLSANLEDLDSQHQQAMERLLGLKKELQKNFELLKQEHMDLKSNNDQYAEEIKTFQAKLIEKDVELEGVNALKSSYDTLQHKYQNLDRIHRVLRENTEKFQEENQELHEEVFKLQEKVTKLEHDIEVTTKPGDLADMVPRDQYERVLKKLNELKKDRNTSQLLTDVSNIDDNAKSAIENLKREINDLKHKLNQKNIEDTQPCSKSVKASKIMELISNYLDFELPLDYDGEIPADSETITEFKLESALKTLKKEKESLLHEISEKTYNITHLQAQVEDLSSENEFLTSDVQHFENELSEMKKNNNFLISEIAALKNTSKLQPIIETHEDNIATLETELADCSRINKTFESKIRSIEKELLEVKAEKKSLKANLLDLKEKYTTMLKDFEVCKTQTKAVEELGTTVANKNKNTTDENHDLKNKLGAANMRAEKLAINMQILENDKVLLLKNIDDLTHEIKKNIPFKINEQDVTSTLLKNKVKDLEGQLNVTTRRSNEMVNYNLELEEKIKELESQVRVANETQEKIKTENVNIIAMLKAENITLKEAVEKMSKEFKLLGENELKLAKENHALKSNQTAVEKAYSELKSEIKEVERLQSENKLLSMMKKQMEMDQVTTESKIKKLEEDFDKILNDLSEKDNIIKSLNENISVNNGAISNLENNLLDKTKEIEHLRQKISNLKNKLSKADEASNKTTTDYEALLEQNQELEKQLTALHEEIDQRNNMITDIKIKLEDAHAMRNSYEKKIEQNEKKIKELNQTIQLNDKESSSDAEINEHENNYKEQTDLCKKINNEKVALLAEIESIKHQLEYKDEEITHLKSELHNVTISEQNAIAVAAKEKEELIKLINSKHNESVHYHSEIQRLNKLILETAEKFKKAIEQKDNLLRSQNKTCEKCDSLKKKIRSLEETNNSVSKTCNAAELEKLKTDLATANETIKQLTVKCDNTTEALEIQIETVKKLKAENTQLQDQEAVSARELDRLRQHLIECQESYTEELMSSEQKLNEATARLAKVEEKAKQTSTVYTSNSIRANQEVETYKNQIKLLTSRRAEDAARLAAAEDARSRLEVALANLQLVLEQFQLDKDRDIEAAVVKLNNKIVDSKAENNRHKEEIQNLNRKLEESVAGLQAAARLGDELENKTTQIHELKEQVRALQASVASAEERYLDTVNNQHDKVDRRLVKNLVLNYVLSQGQSNVNRTQVLRILSSVLDFNQTECTSLGLRGAGAAPGAGGESLARQFVRFLEQESMNPRDVIVETHEDNTTVTPPTTEPSHKRNLSTGSNNVLFQNLDNLEVSSQISTGSTHSETRSFTMNPILDTGVNQTRNNEGAILKHVLRDI